MTVDEAMVTAAEIRWTLAEAPPFDDLDVALEALSRDALTSYIAELRAECRFLRAAWHAAIERQPVEARDRDYRAVCLVLREVLLARWTAEAAR